MKNTIKKINVGLLAIVLGLGLVFTQSAFKSTNRVQTWVFTQAVDADIRNGENYQLNGTPSEFCDEVAQLPCSINVEDESIDTPTELSTYLSTKTDAQIFAIADGRVPEL